MSASDRAGGQQRQPESSDNRARGICAATREQAERVCEAPRSNFQESELLWAAADRGGGLVLFHILTEIQRQATLQLTYSWLRFA